ncbi:hypothetical protein [Streptococcus uberis]|nr:hypothetical protein [Streptococcus uberis]MCK1228213.1 hypothetical protein [Streptococcus uberis]MEE3698319.1 hypothetical protein [Streptococcus uberis]MTB56118.1 hypothetical protein [Streptococcus uberis]MTC84148.1 hypothetical protein [Streptococcus uberis]
MMSIKLAALTFIAVLMAPFIWFQLTRGNFSYDLLDSIVIAALSTFFSQLIMHFQKRP